MRRTRFRLDLFNKESFSPENISGMMVWLRANSIQGEGTNTPISLWEDFSENNNDATQATFNSRPTYQATGFNGFPSLRFDATDDSMGINPAFIVTRPYTMIICAQSRGLGQTRILNSTSGNRLATFGRGMNAVYIDGDIVNSTAATPGLNPAIGILRGSTTESNFRVNGADITNTASPRGDWGTVTLGAFGQFAEPANCDLADVLIYNSYLPSSLCRNIELFFSSQYNLGIT